MTVEVEDDISADVAAAFRESVPDPAPVVAKPAEVAPVAPVEAKPEPVEAKAPEDKGAPQRAPDGKFAKSTETVLDTVAIGAPEPAETTFSPPNAWKAEAKAVFASLPPLAQEEIARRELDMQRGVQKLQQEASRYAPIEELLAPHRQQWAAQGINDAQAVQQLLGAHVWLTKDPQAALNYLARQYGAQLPQMGQAGPQPDPQYAALQNQLSTLQAEIRTQKQQEAQAAQTQTQTQIDAFAADPKNSYFEDVKADMATLLDAGRATDLQGAYDMAIWMRPDIRQLVQTDQAKAKQAEKTAADRAKADAAKKAGGSITGSSSANGSAVTAVNQNSSIEDDVRSAWQSAAGRA